MNHLDMMTTLVDAARQLPESRHLKVAIKTAEKRIEHLREKKLRRDGSRMARKLIASCIKCKQQLADCCCWDETRCCWYHSLIPGAPFPSYVLSYSEAARQ